MAGNPPSYVRWVNLVHLLVVELSFGLNVLNSSLRPSLPVCAPLITWQKGTSYFHAELLRLQQLVNMAQHEERLFIILDEILKGTNS